MFKVRSITFLVLLSLVAVVGCRSAHTTSAILYVDEKQYDKAVAVLHEGLEYNPNEPDAYFWLGKTHGFLAEVSIEDNDYVEAIKHFELAYMYLERAVELDPESFSEVAHEEVMISFTNQNIRAREELQDGYYEQCEGFYRLAYAALPDSVGPIKNIARMKMRQAYEVGIGVEQEALYNEALELLDQVLAEQPEVYDLLADKANVLTRLNRLEEANAIYDNLIREHGDDDMLLVDIANLAVSQGEFERAADLMVRIISIRENDDNVDNDAENRMMLVNAASWYSDVRRYPEALDLLDRAGVMETTPKENTLYNRLRTYYDYGMFLKGQAVGEEDVAARAELETRATGMFERGVEVGNALVQQFVDAKFGFYFLSQCQFELGDNVAAEANLKLYSALETMEGVGTETP